MILGIHIIIALVSILTASYVSIRPGMRILRTTAVFVASTVASGIYISLIMDASMLRMCISGLVYISIVCMLMVVAQQKLYKLRTK